MNRAFIIDDDNGAILSVYNSFDWKRLKVDNIETITNPNNVAEKILSDKPELVFIDIEMGEISGLDIIRQVREHDSEIIFVIISGHNDFSYAQTAIKYGVKYYLLKPVMPSAVEEITDLLCVALREKGKHNSEIFDMSSILSDKVLFTEYLIENDLVFPGEYLFLVARYLGRSGTDDIILCLNNSLCAHHKIGRKSHLFILKSDKYTKSVESMIKNISVTKKCFLGMSDVLSSSEDIYTSFQKANTLSYGYFITENCDLLKYRIFDGFLIRSFLDTLLEFLEQEKYTLFFEKLRQAPKYFKENNFNVKQAQLMHNTIAYKINTICSKSASEPMPILNFEDLVSEYSSMQEMCTELEDIITGLLEYDINDIPRQSNAFFQNILDYINENYSKKLTLSVLCKEFYISTSHFCELFRKNVNQTFIEYLTNVRMQKAKELMKNESVSIAKVAESVGYSDYFYFNKLFSKYVGCTPSKYCKKIQKKNIKN